MNPFGIVAIVTSVLGIVTPTLGMAFSGVSGLFALFALKSKDSFAQSSLILNLLNLTVFSPFTFASIFSKSVFFNTNQLKIVYGLILVIQVIGLVLWWLYSKENEVTEQDKLKERIEPKL
ncbi:hypothetical protein KW525_05125 [Vibrio fluvialis]|nr:hypothetical protein [Vibrio fluvialis]